MRWPIAMLLLGALGASACGSGGATFANDPRPPIPVDLAVYIDDARVSVSPISIGAGPVRFIITNQASRTESLTVAPAGSATALASSGPLVSQATAQLSVDLGTPGDYVVAVAGAAARLAGAQPSIQPASLHIGPMRPSASDALLQP
jgi:hypothetical protein